MEPTLTEQLPRIASPEPIGRQLDARYALYDDVGSGPLAHVYRAWDYQISHCVALKILDQRFADNQVVVGAFEAEGRRVAGLPAHPNIVSLHEVGHDGAIPYTVMEYVPGQSLRSIISAEAPLSVDQAFTICRQVAEALEFAHEYGVVHGNLKPENILLLKNGRAKVTDFGVGRVMDIAETLGALPPVARARYAAPEQALGQDPGPTSDVYSLGVVLFEMLTGSLPSQISDLSSILSDHPAESSRRLQRLNPTIPLSVWRIVFQALTKNPQGRYRAAGAFASALHQYLLLEAGSTVMGMPADQIRATAPETGTAPTLIAMPETATGPTLVAMPATGTVPALVARSTPQPSSAPSVWRQARVADSHRLTVMSLIFILTLAIACVGGWLAYRATSELLKNWGVPSALIAAQSIQHLLTYLPI